MEVVPCSLLGMPLGLVKCRSDASSSLRISMHAFPLFGLPYRGRPSEDSPESPSGIVDVLSTSNWGLRNPLLDAVFAPAAHIHGDIFTSHAFPSHAFSINYADPGYIKINKDTRESVHVKLEAAAHSCDNATSMAISVHNRHGYVACNAKDYLSSNHGKFIVEVDLDTDQVRLEGGKAERKLGGSTLLCSTVCVFSTIARFSVEADLNLAESWKMGLDVCCHLVVHSVLLFWFLEAGTIVLCSQLMLQVALVNGIPRQVRTQSCDAHSPISTIHTKPPVLALFPHQVVQTLDFAGEPHATDDGEYIVIVDNIDHKLHIYEVSKHCLNIHRHMVSDLNPASIVSTHIDIWSLI